MQLSLAFAQQPDKLSFEVKSERAQNEEKQGYETSRKRRRKRTAVLYGNANNEILYSVLWKPQSSHVPLIYYTKSFVFSLFKNG